MPEEALTKRSRPEVFAEAHDRLGLLERFNIGFIRHTFEIRLIDRLLRLCQRTLGTFWIHHCTKNLTMVQGLERVPESAHSESVILAANHRSFFDMYVINAILFRHGFNQRLLFPVRSNFFYDNPLGFFVNGIMSFWSMYPPIFRDRKRITLNHAAFNELCEALKEGRGTGVHPEGTRKKDDDPYTFLPAQAGTGRLIYHARVPVLPVFINGLINDLPKQIAGNFNKKGKKVIVVFGEPIDFGELLEEPASGKTYRKIADRTLEAIGALGQEEKKFRETLPIE